MAYYSRGLTYYFKKEYDKSWDDITKAQDLDYQVPPEILEILERLREGRSKDFFE
jgi:hypothetical protein